MIKVFNNSTGNRVSGGKGIGKTLGDVGLGIADTTLGALGLNNVIDQKDYQTRFGDKTLNKSADFLGGAANQVGASYLNTLLPGSGTLFQGATGMISNTGLNTSTEGQDNSAQVTKGQNIAQSTMGIMGNFLPKMTNGGDPSLLSMLAPGQPQYEAENNEVVQGNPVTFNGKAQFNASDMATLKGATHAQGGIDVAGGDRVFSDKLKNPTTNKTFAKDADELAKMKGKFEKKLDRNKFDKLTIKTNQANLANIDKEIDDLFNTQEAIKQAKLQKSINTAVLKYGGNLPKAANGLDLINDPTRFKQLQELVSIAQGQDSYRNPNNHMYPMTGLGQRFQGADPIIGANPYLANSPYANVDSNYSMKVNDLPEFTVNDISGGFNPGNFKRQPAQTNLGLAQGQQFDFRPYLKSNSISPDIGVDNFGTPLNGATLQSKAYPNIDPASLRPDMNQGIEDIAPLLSSGNTNQAQRAEALGDPAQAIMTMNKLPKDKTPRDYTALKQGLYDVSTNAPSYYNLGKGLFEKPQQLKTEDYINPNQAEVMSRLDGLNYNINPQLEANKRTFNSMRENIADASGGNAGSYLTNVGAAQLRKSNVDNQLYAEKNNIDNQYKTNAANALNQFGNQYAQTKWNVNDYNQRAIAAKDKLVQEGLTGFSNINQLDILMKHQKDMNQLNYQAEMAKSPYHRFNQKTGQFDYIGDEGAKKDTSAFQTNTPVTQNELPTMLDDNGNPILDFGTLGNTPKKVFKYGGKVKYC